MRAQGTSLRRACRLIGLSTATWRYQRQADPTNTQTPRTTAGACRRATRFGDRRLHTLVDRDGRHVNHKRVYGVYRTAGLQVRRRRRKRLTRGQRVPLPLPSRRGERWSMDIMVDTLADGRGFRTLNIVDDCTRECVALEVDRSLPGLRVVRVLDRLAAAVGLPEGDRGSQSVHEIGSSPSVGRGDGGACRLAGAARRRTFPHPFKSQMLRGLPTSTRPPHPNSLRSRPSGGPRTKVQGFSCPRHRRISGTCGAAVSGKTPVSRGSS